jgi:hypothetical protein
MIANQTVCEIVNTCDSKIDGILVKVTGVSGGDEYVYIIERANGQLLYKHHNCCTLSESCLRSKYAF